MLHRLVFSLYILLFFHPTSAQLPDNYRSYLKNTEVRIDSTNLPIVFINVDGQMILKDDYILAKIKIIHNGNGELNYGDTIVHPGQKVDYEGFIALRYRGHSSFSMSNKKPFSFRTLKTATLPKDGGEKKKVSILGMAKDNKWAMLAPWMDRSMIRDALSYNLARPWMDFVPQTRHCEVILDGTYYGIYVLLERVSQGKNRLNLKDANEINDGVETDILVYIDRDNDECFYSPNHPYGVDGIREDKIIKYQYKFPEADDFSILPTGIKNFVDGKISLMEESFLTNQYKDPIMGCQNTVDIQSFVDYMLSVEASNNSDGYRLSTYLYRLCNKSAQVEDRDTLWRMCIWDFNQAWGNSMYYGHSAFDTWHYNINRKPEFSSDMEWVPFYWDKLLNDDTFMDKVRRRWNEYRQTNYSDDNISEQIDSLTNHLQIGGSISRNTEAWDFFNTTIWGVSYNVDSYEEEIAYLKKWIRSRFAFMDKELSMNETVIMNQKMTNTSVIYTLNGCALQGRPLKGLYLVKGSDGNYQKRLYK